jgi:hypothetical protein
MSTFTPLLSKISHPLSTRRLSWFADSLPESEPVDVPVTLVPLSAAVLATASVFRRCAPDVSLEVPEPPSAPLDFVAEGWINTYMRALADSYTKVDIAIDRHQGDKSEGRVK